MHECIKIHDEKLCFLLQATKTLFIVSFLNERDGILKEFNCYSCIFTLTDRMKNKNLIQILQRIDLRSTSQVGRSDLKS
jgi:hypothetical protein